MGTTSVKVSDKFQFLATFPYSNPTKNDIKRLDRRINKALCRIKCLNLSKDRVKMLLDEGFDSSKLIEWSKELIDGVINSDNAESCVLLSKLIERIANKIRYLEPLKILRHKYMNALYTDKVNIDLSSVAKIIRTVVIIFVLLFLHVAVVNRTQLKKTDIIMAKEMIDDTATPDYIKRFFPFIKIPDLSRPYKEGPEGATKDNPNIDIQSGALVVSSIGVINSPNVNDEHKDMTAIGQYITIDKKEYVYLPESIYFGGNLLKCYYNLTTGAIRYVQNPGNDFKPISELLDDYDQPLPRPWVNLPNTYPLSRTKDENASNITPYSYINLDTLKDATPLIRMAKIIQMPSGGIRIPYEDKSGPGWVGPVLFTFYTIYNDIATALISDDLIPVGLACGKYPIDTKVEEKLSDQGLYKVYTNNYVNETLDMITIGSYGYLVMGEHFNSDNGTHKAYLTGLLKRLIPYQKKEQY